MPICLKIQFKGTAELVNETGASLQHSVLVKGEVVHIHFYLRRETGGYLMHVLQRINC